MRDQPDPARRPTEAGLAADPTSGWLGQLARVCYRRRAVVLLAWVLGTAVLVVIGVRFGAPFDNSFAGGKTESAQAQELMQQHFPQQNGDTLTLAIQAEAGLDDPSVRSRVDNLLGRLRAAPHISSVTSLNAAPNQMSADRKTAFATIQADEGTLPASEVTSMISEVRGASGSQVTFALSGMSVYMVETPYGGPSEGVGGAAAIVVLLISFGSLLAMGLPMVTALFGIASGLAAINLLGHLIPSPVTAPIVASLIALGVGVDYALFILTRYREELARGAAPEEATVAALATAGKSVLFAGTTVVIALLGLFVMQVQFIDAMALAASVTVFATMVASITLLPALLGFTGRHIDSFKLPLLGRAPTGRPLAERWAGVIQRRPLVAAVGAAALLLALAFPALSMRLSFPDSSTQPHDTSGYTSHSILASGFGAGYDAPLLVVAQLPPVGGDLAPVVDAVRATPGVAGVSPPRISQDRAAAFFIAYPTTGFQDAATPALVHKLREDVIPTAARDSHVRIYVGGPNASTIDFADGVRARLPWLILIVVGLSVIVLLALVRSVAIAVKAAVMNVLSIAAAYGVLTAIVQWGWLGRQLGFPTSMPITHWVPLFMFPILFGLSTDYEVFLISRIREEHDRGAPTRDAVTRGLARTARVITAAAAIMVTVFASNLLAPENSNKEFGLGLAAAVLIDATVVRLVLVPAFMELLGEVNWWLPRPLARLLPRPVVAG